MKDNCTNCDFLLGPKSHFCPNCGYSQNQRTAFTQQNTVFLTILCVFTIFGSVFTVLRAFVYVSFGIEETAMIMRVLSYIFTSIGTTIGAVKMLKKDEAGLMIYSVSQVIYIITVFFALSHYIKELGGLFGGGTGFATSVAMLFIVPSILILFIYWLPDTRKHLKP